MTSNELYEKALSGKLVFKSLEEIYEECAQALKRHPAELTEDDKKQAALNAILDGIRIADYEPELLISQIILQDLIEQDRRIYAELVKLFSVPAGDDIMGEDGEPTTRVHTNRDAPK